MAGRQADAAQLAALQRPLAARKLAQRPETIGNSVNCPELMVSTFFQESSHVAPACYTAHVSLLRALRFQGGRIADQLV